MEIFMRNIPPRFDEVDIEIFLASILHSAHFDYAETNFFLQLHKPKRPLMSTRTGTFTVADITVGQKFLQVHGGDLNAAYLNGNIPIYFKESIRRPRPEVIELLSHTPWVDPSREEHNVPYMGSTTTSVRISGIQFCWSCRDGVHSIEAEAVRDATLSFDRERRELRTIAARGDIIDVIAIKLSIVRSMFQHFSYDDGKHVLLLELGQPPMFLKHDNSIYEMYPFMEDYPVVYSRLSTYPPLANSRAIPFASLVLRFVFPSGKESELFSKVARTAGLGRIYHEALPVERRGLFSSTQLAAVEVNVRTFDWPIAFQLVALLQNMVLDATELLSLFPKVRELVAIKGITFTVGLLREFQHSARVLWYDDSEQSESILSCFESVRRDMENQDQPVLLTPDDGSYHESLHVTISPTSMLLEGPFMEKSNRVIRSFSAEHHQNFLRVSFREENNLQYRYDRAVNGRSLVQDRFGKLMKEGLVIAGRRFTFLAYSQSALKEHSVWFVQRFYDGDSIITSRSIIEGLGVFDNLPYDPNLMRCPARYGARISQAFTSTDAAMVQVEKVILLDDIKTPDGKYDFTDGVGTMSTDLAREIWQMRWKKKSQNRDPDEFPRAYQIRFEGSKGMLSVDYTIEDSRCIGLRPSMIKFEARGDVGQHVIEIARAFDSPTPYYLNRPLIMLLEGLGVPYDVFHVFQKRAVREAREATSSLKKAGHLLETYGLGSSFRLPSIMQSLSKLGLVSIHDDTFYHDFLGVSVHHVLRDLKHHARIPIPNAWTLVGVADVHRFLRKGEVFASVKYPGQKAIYIEGPVVISRSPTIHPGDIQIATAIGAPPSGSCFEREPLHNTVVFSIQDTRPLPSCLGGGDLDGDIYNIIPLKNHPYFLPKKAYTPAEYPPAKRKLLLRNSTMNDVADFVVEYITSDVLGVIATYWLIIADKSPAGIADKDCLILAQLHSDAVDYPKSGRAVDIATIPKVRGRIRPDWNAPETIKPDPNGYYISQKAIGKLFRDINLDDNMQLSHRPRRRYYGDPVTGATHQSPFHQIDPDSAVFDVIKREVRKVRNISGPWEQSTVEDVKRIFRHFAAELVGIAGNYNLSHKTNMLSEEEVIVGTITQKTTQPRIRRDQMTRVREKTDTLVKSIRMELEGGEDRTLEDYLGYAWLGLDLSLAEAKKETYGANSFGWLALGAIFDAMKQVEGYKASELRSSMARAG